MNNTRETQWQRAAGVLARDWKLILLVLLMGTGLHFLFGWWPSLVTEFFAPVNESIWEHSKIIFWPLLLVFGLRGRRQGSQRWLAATLTATLALLLAGWTWHVALGGTDLWVDVLIYVAAVCLAFVLAELLPLEPEAAPVLAGLVIIFGALILAFTLNPPQGTLFNDPALADAWVRLPC